MTVYLLTTTYITISTKTIIILAQRDGPGTSPSRLMAITVDACLTIFTQMKYRHTNGQNVSPAILSTLPRSLLHHNPDPFANNIAGSFELMFCCCWLPYMMALRCCSVGSTSSCGPASIPLALHCLRHIFISCCIFNNVYINWLMYIVKLRSRNSPLR